MQSWFIGLHVALMVYANRQLGLVPGLDEEEDFPTSAMADRLKIWTRPRGVNK